MSRKTIPSVEEIPVLPDIVKSKSVKIDLAVSDVGEIYLFHEKKIPEQVNWAEYNKVEGSIDLITVSGRIQGVGLKVKKELNEVMCAATRIYVIYMLNEKPEQIIEIPLVILI